MKTLDEKPIPEGILPTDINPFVRNAVLPVIRKATPVFSSSENGYLINFQENYKYTLIEEQKCSQVYQDPDIHKTVFWTLKNAGRTMLLYIMYNIKDSRDYIKISADTCCPKIFVTKPTMYSGIQELVDVGILAKKAQEQYWINPFYIFRGNRINYFRKLSELLGRETVEVTADLKPTPSWMKRRDIPETPPSQ